MRTVWERLHSVIMSLGRFPTLRGPVCYCFCLKLWTASLGPDCCDGTCLHNMLAVASVTSKIHYCTDRTHVMYGRLTERWQGVCLSEKHGSLRLKTKERMCVCIRHCLLICQSPKRVAWGRLATHGSFFSFIYCRHDGMQFIWPTVFWYTVRKQWCHWVFPVWSCRARNWNVRGKQS